MSGRGAAFLDRDGTIIVDTHYIGRVEDVALLPGAAAAIARLNAAGVPVIVVTNQAGIARGMFTEADYRRVEARVSELLADSGARLTGTYHCPHHPQFTGPCDCRKPGLLLYRRAAAEHALDPAASIFVGDRWHDVSPALSLGGMGILVPSVDTPTADVDRARGEAQVASSLGAAVDFFLGDDAR